MTKKSLAALMLAGAMMTVGSGAMATDITKDQPTSAGGTATVPVTYTTADAINITLTWNDLDPYNYTWNGSVWVISTDQKEGQELTFGALNKGFSDRTVSVTPGNKPEWLTVALKKSGGLEVGEAGTDDKLKITGQGTESKSVAIYNVVPQETADTTVFSGIVSDTTGQTTALTFTVGIE